MAKVKWRSLNTAPRDGTHIVSYSTTDKRAYIMCWVAKEKCFLQNKRWKWCGWYPLEEFEKETGRDYININSPEE